MGRSPQGAPGKFWKVLGCERDQKLSGTWWEGVHRVPQANVGRFWDVKGTKICQAHGGKASTGCPRLILEGFGM